MDKPNGIDFPSSNTQQRGPLARLISATTDMPLLAKFALACIVLAWFFLDTLVVTVGSITHGVRFFDAGAIIADPTRMFFAIDTTFSVILFTLLCLVCLLAPLLPHLWCTRSMQFGYFAPLVLILVCGALLYSKTSREVLATPADVNGLTGSVMSLANKILQHGSDLVSRHVGVGIGGYLAVLASVALAYVGARRLSTKQ